MPRPPDSLAQRLKLARQQRGLSQVQLAAAAGLKQPDVSKLERGDMQKTTAMARLARALKVSDAWLELGEGPDPVWSASHAQPTKQPEELVLSPDEQDLLAAFRTIHPEDQQEVLHDIMALAERANQIVRRALEQRGLPVTGFVSATRAAEKLPAAPTEPKKGAYKMAKPMQHGRAPAAPAKSRRRV